MAPGTYSAPPTNYGYGAAPKLSTWAPMGRVTTDGRSIAEPWQRLLAAILDNLILGIVTAAGSTFPLWRDFVAGSLRPTVDPGPRQQPDRA